MAKQTYFPTPKDPAFSIETMHERLRDAEEILSLYEKRGWDFLAQRQRRRVGGIKGAISRYGRML